MVIHSEKPNNVTVLPLKSMHRCLFHKMDPEAPERSQQAERETSL